jgi:hypothetical protein
MKPHHAGVQKKRPPKAHQAPVQSSNHPLTHEETHPSQPQNMSSYISRTRDNVVLKVVLYTLQLNAPKQPM